MSSALADFIAEYEASFGAFPGDAKNPRAIERWTEFAESVDVRLSTLMDKASEMRGRSRMRPSLADMKLALSACHEVYDKDNRVDCEFCDRNGWIIVLDCYDPRQKWKETAVMGCYPTQGHVVGRSAVPCICANGQRAVPSYPEIKRRQALEWRKNFDASARLAGKDPLEYEREVIEESWKRLRQEAGL